MPKKAAEKKKEIKKPIEEPEKIIEIDEETAVLAADEEDVPRAARPANDVSTVKSAPHLRQTAVKQSSLSAGRW